MWETRLVVFVICEELNGSLDFHLLAKKQLGFSEVDQQVNNCLQRGCQQPREFPLLGLKESYRYWKYECFSAGGTFASGSSVWSRSYRRKGP